MINPNIVCYLEHSRKNPCENCMFSKENSPNNISAECKDCTYEEMRAYPYFVYLPVWREGYMPSLKELKYTVFDSKEEVKDYKIIKEN